MKEENEDFITLFFLGNASCRLTPGPEGTDTLSER